MQAEVQFLQTMPIPYHELNEWQYSGGMYGLLEQNAEFLIAPFLNPC